VLEKTLGKLSHPAGSFVVMRSGRGFVNVSYSPFALAVSGLVRRRASEYLEAVCRAGEDKTTQPGTPSTKPSLPCNRNARKHQGNPKEHVRSSPTSGIRVTSSLREMKYGL
jgi:hypothetical protein